jgi:CRISPR type III-A-associated RAMP protein Csm4
MTSGFLVRLRPVGPWRIGPNTGARHQVDRIYHSDTLYSALCRTFERLGLLEAWLSDTAVEAGEPAVRFSSLFPFLRDVRFVPPPRNLWPPEATSKVNWRGALFVPVSVVQSLLAKRPLRDEDWAVDGESGCLLPVRRNAPVEGPFQISERNIAAVDRIAGECAPHSAAVLEFHPGGGLWFAAGFANEVARGKWSGPVKSAIRLLADSGFGGGRSRGWGRAGEPDFIEGELENLILPPASARRGAAPKAEAGTSAEPDDESESLDTPVEFQEPPQSAGEPDQAASSQMEPVAGTSPVPEKTALSGEPIADAGAEPAEETTPVEQPAFVLAVEPAAGKSVLEASATVTPPTAAYAVVQKQEPEAPAMVWWLLSMYSPAEKDSVDWAKGNYSLAVRGGRIESDQRWGEAKLSLRMVEEGSVLSSPSSPFGTVRNVAPDGFPHPVYRSGFALSIPIPWRVIP